MVSAGIKILDPRSIDLHTGRLLFGLSGDENCETRAAYFPLHVHVAKDNQAFYNAHIHCFFEEINKFEKEYSFGLRFAAPADMCSLLKSVKWVVAMKRVKFACTFTMTWQHQLC